MLERTLTIVKNFGPVVLLVWVGMNWLAHVTTLSITRPVDVVTVAAGPQYVCNLLTDRQALPDWFSWMAEADETTVTRKNYLVPTFEQKVYRFQPQSDRAGQYFVVSILKSNCDPEKPLRVKMRLRHFDPDTLAVRTRDYQPFISVPFRKLGDFKIDYTLDADDGNTRVGYLVTSCAEPYHDNFAACWGSLQITFMGMFEPMFRWPVETAIGNSLHRFKAMVGPAG